MNGFKFAILAAVIAMMLPGMANAADSGKDADVRELMRLTHVERLMKDSVAMQFKQSSTMIKMALKGQYPKMPDAAVEIFLEDLEEAFGATIPEVLERLVPLYSETFSRDEIKAMIGFYETATGRKTITVLPTLMKKAAVIGGKLGAGAGREAGPRIMTKLRELGYDPKDWR